MAFSQDYIISEISSFLWVFDLCSLDATTKEISSGMVSHDGKPYVWLEAAEYAGYITNYGTFF